MLIDWALQARQGPYMSTATRFLDAALHDYNPLFDRKNCNHSNENQRIIFYPLFLYGTEMSYIISTTYAAYVHP